MTFWEVPGEGFYVRANSVIVFSWLFNWDWCYRKN